MPAISLHHISFTTGSIVHIDTKSRWTPSDNQAEMPAIPLHHISFTAGSIAHIDTKGRWAPHLKVSNSHNSFTLYTALHAIQLFVLSFGVELLDRSVIHLLFMYLFICQLTVVVVLLIAYCCCCCVLQQQQKAQVQQQEKIYI